MRTKRLVLMCGIMCMLSFTAKAQDCDEKFEQAQKYEKQGLQAKSAEQLEKAISLYRQLSQCDPDLKGDCEKRISKLKKSIESFNVDLSISTAEVVIPFQGGGKQIDVVTNGKWVIEGESDWFKTEIFKNNSFAINCEEANNECRDRITTLKVKSGETYKSLKVIQEGRPEYIDVEAESLRAPSQGSEQNITIQSNAKWNVRSVPSWCKVEKEDDAIHIIVLPNERQTERGADIIIDSPNKSVTIKLIQNGGEEELSLSQNNLKVPSEGGERRIKVYTNADNWYIGDYPHWMHATRIGNDSICIKFDKNVPNMGVREGGLVVRTDLQQVDVHVSQDAMLMKDIVMPYSTVVGGRNVSFGVSASYYMPFIAASAGGDYVGSVHDYGLGTTDENVSFQSRTGFSFGMFADIRLYKNIFMTAGINYTEIKYTNSFNHTTPYQRSLNYETLKGEVQNSYTERYAHKMIEVPVLASYRFKVNEISQVQLSLGPVMNFGLDATMNFSGNTDGDRLHKYSSQPPYQLTDGGNYFRHTSTNTDFNLYQPCVLWTEMFTEGNDQPVTHHDEFNCAPLNKFNCGLRLGVSYEWAGIAIGVSYTNMITNMAQKNYWDNERWTVLNHSSVTMKGYSQHINTLEFKLAYTLRYLNSKTNE